MNINLHIERVILDGLAVAPSQRGLVQSALEAELVRLLASGGLAAALSSSGAMPVLRVSDLPLAMPSEPAQLGSQIAQAVYGGIGQPEKGTT